MLRSQCGKTTKHLPDFSFSPSMVFSKVEMSSLSQYRRLVLELFVLATEGQACVYEHMCPLQNVILVLPQKETM